MEELSIEEKAKTYDKALERAKGVIEQNPLMEYLKKGIEYIFPELKESEDERIRKWIINDIKTSLNDGIYNSENIDDAKKALDWLEKQGEHANFINKIQIGDKVTRNRDGVLVNLSQLNRVAKVEEKQGKQKPTDEEIKELLRTEYEKGRADAIAEMQKSWSEEDERIFKSLKTLLNDASCYSCTEGVDKILSWLKSLRPQSQWKPSEEQMVAINTAINVLGKGTLNGKQLIELQEQLKAL